MLIQIYLILPLTIFNVELEWFNVILRIVDYIQICKFFIKLKERKRK